MEAKKGKGCICVLGGSLIKDSNGGWRTTNFDEGDQFGCLGDSLRVAAAAVLFHEFKEQNRNFLIVASGGAGQLADISPDAPAVAEIIKRELVVLGVPEEQIFEEKKSGSTFQQLCELKKIIKDPKPGEIIVVTNRYHAPRVFAIARRMGENFDVRSAEEILLKHDLPAWKTIVGNAYNSQAMKERIRLEEKGVEDIKYGRYKF